NVRQLLDAPAARKHGPAVVAACGLDLLLMLTQDNEALQKLVKDSRDNIAKGLQNRKLVLQGMDFLKDRLARVTFAARDDNNDESFMFIVHGDWDAGRLTALLELGTKLAGMEMKTIKFGEQKMYEIKLDDDDTMFLALPEKGVAVA